MTFLSTSEHWEAFKRSIQFVSPDASWNVVNFDKYDKYIQIENGYGEEVASVNSDDVAHYEAKSIAILMGAAPQLAQEVERLRSALTEIALTSAARSQSPEVILENILSFVKDVLENKE